jgi:hypothetical protein
MKAPFTLGVVGHFGLAVRNPKKSAQWFQRALRLRKELEFDDSVAVGNDNVRSFYSKVSRRRKRSAYVISPAEHGHTAKRRLTISRNRMLSWKIRATRSVRKLPGSPIFPHCEAGSRSGFYRLPRADSPVSYCSAASVGCFSETRDAVIAC